jgi:orotidine-5'-phosphate decarboxylase
MAALRKAHPRLTFLVPGIGAQGGDLERMLEAGLDESGTGLLINSARGVIYAGGGEAPAIRAAAQALYDGINRWRESRR